MVGVTAVEIPLTIKGTVELTELTLVMPVAFVRLTVGVLAEAVMLTISIPVMVVGVTLLITLAVKVSEPAPPTSASLDCHV